VDARLATPPTAALTSECQSLVLHPSPTRRTRTFARSPRELHPHVESRLRLELMLLPNRRHRHHLCHAYTTTSANRGGSRPATPHPLSGVRSAMAFISSSASRAQVSNKTQRPSQPRAALCFRPICPRERAVVVRSGSSVALKDAGGAVRAGLPSLPTAPAAAWSAHPKPVSRKCPPSGWIELHLSAATHW
jgi:hypothetical protein